MLTLLITTQCAALLAMFMVTKGDARRATQRKVERKLQRQRAWNAYSQAMPHDFGAPCLFVEGGK